MAVVGLLWCCKVLMNFFGFKTALAGWSSGVLADQRFALLLGSIATATWVHPALKGLNWLKTFTQMGGFLGGFPHHHSKLP